MVRNVSLAALGFTLICAAFTSLGLFQEVSGPRSAFQVVRQAGLDPNHDPFELRRAVVTAFAASQSAFSLPLSSGVQDDPVSPPIQAPGRPKARDFLASGPLVTRLADPTFGPVARPDDLLIPDPPADLAGASDLLCIAVAIYHEARDQALDGQLAVASVILNRTKEPDRWGATPCDVVVPVQFSFMRDDGSYPAIPKDEAWAIAVEMAREALERGPSTLVGQADHYHTPAVDPDWNEDMEQVVRIEDHIFFVDPKVRG
jgi:ribosomal protein L14